MLRKKFFKILSVMVAVIVTSFPFCFSASAVTNSNNLYFNGFHVEAIYVGVFNSQGQAIDTQITLYNPSTPNRLEIYADRVSGNFVAGEEYLFKVDLVTDNSLVSSDNYVVGSYDITSWDYYQTITSVVTSYRNGYKGEGVDLTYNNQYSNNSPVSFDNNSLKGFRAYFGKGNIGYQYDNYHFSVRMTCNRDRDLLGIFMQNFDFKTLTPSEAAADELAHGWQSSGGLDTSVSDDYHNKENEILNNTASGRNDTISLFNNFGSLFTTGYFLNGVLAVSRILTKFIEVDWISGLLQLALSIGIFAFLIGSVQIIGSRISRNNSTKGGKGNV